MSCCFIGTRGNFSFKCDFRFFSIPNICYRKGKLKWLRVFSPYLAFIKGLYLLPHQYNKNKQYLPHHFFLTADNLKKHGFVHGAIQPFFPSLFSMKIDMRTKLLTLYCLNVQKGTLPYVPVNVFSSNVNSKVKVLMFLWWLRRTSLLRNHAKNTCTAMITIYSPV